MLRNLALDWEGCWCAESVSDLRGIPGSHGSHFILNYFSCPSWGSFYITWWLCITRYWILKHPHYPANPERNLEEFFLLRRVRHLKLLHTPWTSIPKPWKRETREVQAEKEKRVRAVFRRTWAHPEILPIPQLSVAREGRMGRAVLLSITAAPANHVHLWDHVYRRGRRALCIENESMFSWIN